MKMRVIDGIEIEEGSGNVYADLGMADAGEMLIKCQLAMKIEEIIKSRRWTQQQAAEVMGVPQPKLSKMLRGQFRGISQTKMLECLNRLGRDVQIVVGPPRRTRAGAVGRLDVVFA
jgi:predicted XRE-type DNA-binding protein